MKNHIYLLLFLSAFVFALFSCDDDNNINSPEYSIYGSWVRNITDSQGIQFTAELKINDDKTFNFITLTNAPGHTNSSAEYLLSSSQFTIINDSDCSVTGIYNYVLSENALALVSENDDCAPRVSAIQGIWNKK